MVISFLSKLRFDIKFFHRTQGPAKICTHHTDQTLFGLCLTWKAGTIYVGVNMGRPEMWQTSPVISYVPVSGSYVSTQVRKTVYVSY